MSNFKARFANLIENSGKTQQQIGCELNVTKQKISQWKTGYIQPDIDNLISLAKYFDVSVEYLIGISDDDTPIIYDVEYQKPEILEIYDDLTPQQQENLLNYARGMAVSNSLEMKINRKKA